jgi:peptidoglycan/xylan/chitin deacetylase (PgdA/CDA1 family)
MASGAVRRARTSLAGRGAIVVLALHRVLEDEPFMRTNSLAGMVLRRRTFSKMAAYVSARFQTVSLHGATPDRGPRTVRIAFTFDDGWRDTYDCAFPAARAAGVPMTIFLCPGLLSRYNPFWPEQVSGSLRARHPGIREADVRSVIEQLKASSPEVRGRAVRACVEATEHQADPANPDRTLNWTDIDEMDRAGVTFGAHTRTHQILTSIDESAALDEVLTSKAAIEGRLARPCTLFSYPNGNYSDTVKRLVADAGISLAFTMDRGAWTAGADILAIPRVNLAEDDVTGPAGRFSRVMFEYAVFWKAARASRARGELA